jgi:uncharacterized caspase-like protein
MASDRIMDAEAHALIIGISRYRHVPPLRATRDAGDLAEVLADPELCGYPPANVRLLQEEQATRGAILAEFDALARRTSENSKVFIYFCGHGVRATGDCGHSYYLLPVDGEAGRPEDLKGSGVSAAELSEKLRVMVAATLTLVLECCHAAELAKGLFRPAGAAGAAGEVPPPCRSWTVLAAARSDAYTLPRRVHSSFTGHLLVGLRGAAVGNDGTIRICGLFEYVQQRLAAEPVPQQPLFRAELEQNYVLAIPQGGACSASHRLIPYFQAGRDL